MSKSPSGMNQSRILINTVTCSIRPRKLLHYLNSHSTKNGYDYFKFWISIQNVFSHNGLLYRDEFCKRIIYATGNLKFHSSKFSNQSIIRVCTKFRPKSILVNFTVPTLYIAYELCSINWDSLITCIGHK